MRRFGLTLQDLLIKSAAPGILSAAPSPSQHESRSGQWDDFAFRTDRHDGQWKANVGN
jgi:hypothetical protein